ncbi:DNA repair protein RecN [Deinococcus ruber]|uniref:DNA repair protein RecN n=1 Tax=Deinococcus ruber TaxID=1848197 RepID=A0A918BVL7_9DEIO|nr:DNA repair protein RecN [Deinococcus ruber]GGQ94395.1 DNA repair protein RecN [Deinococcus ruber]
MAPKRQFLTATPPTPTQPAVLTRLEVRRLATIETLELDLERGFSAFTGETGAGKSIIVDALGLLLGQRGGADLVRTGSDDLLVTGFVEDTAISRRVTAQGRSTARLDGEVISLRELGEWTTQRLTIHWQHSAHTLLSPAHQRALLDRQLDSEPAAYAAAYREWQTARTRLEDLKRGERERARQLDLLEFQAQELAEAAPVVGEEEPLQAELNRLANLESIALGAAGALELLSDGEVSAVPLLLEAVRSLNAGAKYDETSAQLQTELRTAVEAVQAVAGELRALSEDSAPDPEELDRIQTRLSLLARLKTKYGPTLEDVLEFQAKVENELSSVRRDDSDAGTLEGEVARLEGLLRAEGQKLTLARRAQGGPLADSLLRVIRELGMPHARLEFRLPPLPHPGAHGLEDVQIIFGANPGEESGPLAEVASGGELSRVMLAISTVLGASTPAVVFDEVDAGIGGAAALAVAAQLSRLAQSRQVLAVTHLAQIAARADNHYKVEKQVEGGRTVSRVRRLAGQERLEEIARMLSGNTSEAALRHARELLGGNAAPTP